ncbi:UNVERIFIED_CONTAM: hypothetical protein GTU68_065684 [Idotea baltica]|nr:hypothetical protein [Idotea baltica]
MSKQKVVVLTGAGISAESGIKTFRDADGLWEGHDVMEVASPMGWASNPVLVLDFYNQRRMQLLEVEPNRGHHALTELEEDFETTIITQNVDDLHERAGSSNVLHLHGELNKVRSIQNRNLVYDWAGKQLVLGDKGEDGAQLRPHIVWFGEDVPMIQVAVDLVSQADVLIIIGTSMVVYPANTLVDYAPDHAEIYFVDPQPLTYNTHKDVIQIQENGTTGVPKVVAKLLARK